MPRTKQIYNISSFDRDTGTTSDFTIKIPDFVEYDWDRVVCLSASIPASYYNIRPGQNSFTVIENGTPYTITLTPSNYTRRSFAYKLAEALNNTASWTYAISYTTNPNEPDDGKYTYSVSGNGGLQPQFVIDNLIGEPMGFDVGTYTFSADVLRSVNVINISIETNLFLRSDICQTHNNILQSIVVDNPSYTQIKFLNPAPEYYEKKYSGNKSNSFFFTLTDELNNVIDLNGQSMSFVIALYKD